MGALAFPGVDTLRLALINGVVAPESAAQPVRAGYDRFGRLWLLPITLLPRETVSGLHRLGVTMLAPSESIEFQPFDCWHQVVPLEGAEFSAVVAGAVLMEMPDHLAPIVAAEIQRLSKSPDEVQLIQPAANEFTMLLRVTDPPVYSVLRGQSHDDLTVYVERAPRVWVQAGWQHPLAGLLTPADDAMLLIRAPRDWRLLPSARSGRVGMLPLPQPLTARLLRDTKRPISFASPLHLVPAPMVASPEIWIIDDQPMEQLQALVECASDAALARWELAITAEGARTIVLLRALPAKRPPADLMLRGLGCVSYLRMPNLFVPAGMALKPPLRRDQARRWLAERDDLITLLLPSGDGVPVPTRVPDSLFQPLLRACTYDVPQRRPLTAVTPRVPLPFELFSIAPEPNYRPATTAVSHRPASVPPAAPVVAAENAESPGLLTRLRRLFQPASASPPPAKGMDVAAAVRTAMPELAAPPTAMEQGRRLKHQERRHALEERFMQALAPDHVAERAELWPQLAGAHADLGQFTDAAACWLNALWELETPPPLWLRGWLQAEKMLSRVPLLEDDLQMLLDLPPSPASVRTLAAWVVWLASQNDRAPALIAGARRIQHRLESYERWLPVRAAWLAQCCLTRLARGDVLALARTRDRLLDRLYHHGLSLEQDVPSFLRFGGRDAGEKFPSVRDWLQRIRDVIHRWIDALVSQRPASYALTLPPDFADRDGRCTKGYVDLMLAWGLARLGEGTAAKHQWQAGRDALARRDETASRLLVGIFEYRVQLALDGKPLDEPLPASIREELDRLTAPPVQHRSLLALYAVETLRSRSRILAPQERVEPFRRLVAARYLDGVEQELARWPDLHGEELARRVASFHRDHADDRIAMPAVLDVALDRTPQLGEKRSLPLLERAETMLDRLAPGLPALLLLEQALAAAADFHLDEFGRRLAGRLSDFLAHRTLDFNAVLRSCRQPPQPELRERVEQWPGRCLQHLHRLGLRVEAERLEPRIRDWILDAVSLTRDRRSQSESWLPVLRTVLNLIGDQPAGGKDEFATTMLDLARKQLLYGINIATGECAALACSYVAALSRSPVRVAQGRIEEILRDVTRLHDASQTNAFFALSPLRLVDAIVRAVVNDDFALSPAIRGWLTDDDFRVRRRMQHDLQAMLMQQRS